MLEVLFELLFEGLGQVIGEALIEIGIVGVRAPFEKRGNPVVSCIALLVLGAALGALLAWLAPERLTPWRAPPGASLVVAPLIAGGCMHAFGRWRASRGHSVTNLATFHGGASFAFGSALVRYLMLR